MDGKVGWKTVSQVIILWGEGTRRDLGAPLNYVFNCISPSRATPRPVIQLAPIS